MNNSVTLQKPNRHRKNMIKIVILAVITLASVIGYLLIKDGNKRRKA